MIFAVQQLDDRPSPEEWAVRTKHEMRFVSVPQSAGNLSTKIVVTKLKNVVGNGGDIDLIILMGGACNIYKEALQDAYPDHDIVVLQNPITSICRGMHLGGIQYYRALKKSQAA